MLFSENLLACLSAVPLRGQHSGLSVTTSPYPLPFLYLHRPYPHPPSIHPWIISEDFLPGSPISNIIFLIHYLSSAHVQVVSTRLVSLYLWTSIWAVPCFNHVFLLIPSGMYERWSILHCAKAWLWSMYSNNFLLEPTIASAVWLWHAEACL